MPIRTVDDLPTTADVVVIGGGIVGAATAFHASRAGLRVLLAEKRPALSTLTTAAAAGGFRLQLDNREELELIRESVELFLDFEEATGQREHDPRVRQQGYLWVTTDPERAAAHPPLVEAHRAWGLDDVELLTGDEARRRFPYLAPEVLSARFRQADGLLDPRGAALGLAVGSKADVALACEVTGFLVRGERCVGVETSRGRVEAGSVVIAGGPLSGLAASAAGVRLPIETVARQKLIVPEVPEVPQDAPMTIDEDTAAHWRPALAGAFLLHTDPATPATSPTEHVPIDHDFAFALLDPASPVSVARVAPFWTDVWERGGPTWMLQAGQYAMTPDRRPLLGPIGPEGLFVNTGYSGHGVMGGPAGSRHLVDVLTGKAQDNPFAPDRTFGERPRLDPL